MNRKKINKSKIRCIAYLSVQDDSYKVAASENRQLRYISEYAKAHNLIIHKIVRRNGLNQTVANRHWEQMIRLIQKGDVDGILLVNMQAVASNVADAYLKVGQVSEVGGIVITVDEGKLGLPIRRMKEGRMVLVNERF